MNSNFKNLLTKPAHIGYREDSQKLPKGGRFPFRNEYSANNRITLNTCNTALFKVLDGGRSFIPRGMGASAFGDVTIPAAFFASHKIGELITQRRQAMPNNSSYSFCQYLSNFIHFIHLIFFNGQYYSAQSISNHITLEVLP